MEKILVIEDDADNRHLLIDLLTHHGYETAAARNGLEGLHMARTCEPALILLDIHMPVMDGVAFRRHQLHDPAIAPIPVVCVSAVDEAPRLARELGALEHVGKPIDFDRLLRVVESVLPRT